MEYIEKKYETSKKALANLQTGSERFAAIKKVRKSDEEEYLERRDSLIKRFELAFDTLWKYGKVYLEVKAGLMHNSPKSVFRELLRINLISEQEVSLALEMVDVRNQTTHTYQDEFAEEVSGKIPGFCLLMERVLDALNPLEKASRKNNN